MISHVIWTTPLQGWDIAVTRLGYCRRYGVKHKTINQSGGPNLNVSGKTLIDIEIGDMTYTEDVQLIVAWLAC